MHSQSPDVARGRCPLEDGVGCVYVGTAPLEIQREAITLLRVKEWCKVLRVF